MTASSSKANTISIRYPATGATDISHYDAAIIGAGHNGLATAKILTDRGLRVVSLEKNDFVGGIAGTREVFEGCRNDIGATYLFPIVERLAEELEFEKFGTEFIDMPIASINLMGPDDHPLVMYSDMTKMAEHVYRDFGEVAAMGFLNLAEYVRFPSQVMDRFGLRTPPRSISEVFACATKETEREQLRTLFFGSAMDLIDRFFPDRVRHRTIRAMMAFMAVQSSYKGPYSAGSAFCFLYAMSNNNESKGLMRRPRGGMGSLSESLRRAIESKGGEVHLKAPVSEIIFEGGRAAGVRLVNGDEVRARCVISNLDKHSTFYDLVGKDRLPTDLAKRIQMITSRGAYMHILWKFRELPEFGGPYKYLNEDVHFRVGASMFVDPEELQTQWHQCRFGAAPDNPATSVAIPSIADPSLAPAGKHIGNSYLFYYPCTAPKSERGKLKDLIFDRALDKISTYMPGIRDCIERRAVFASDHFTTMTGTAYGDFCHGLLHPEEMFEYRQTTPGESAYSTPIEDLYLCGSSTHPGPGVTFIPGYNCGHEVADRLTGEGRRPAAQ